MLLSNVPPPARLKFPVGFGLRVAEVIGTGRLNANPVMYPPSLAFVVLVSVIWIDADVGLMLSTAMVPLNFPRLEVLESATRAAELSATKAARADPGLARAASPTSSAAARRRGVRRAGRIGRVLL